MKIRNGFVSNSSSSSFIIAVKSDISENEKKSLFKKYIEEHYKKASQEWRDEQKLSSEDKVVHDIFEGKCGDLELDDWYVHWGECGSEDSDFLSWLLYSLPEIDTPKFKFKSYC